MNRATTSEMYSFHLRGELSDRVLADFAELEATQHEGETVLSGSIPDQAALFGVLDRIEALGIHLLEVRRAMAES